MITPQSIVSQFKTAITFPRPSYLPKEVKDKDPIIPEGTDLAIWSWEAPNAAGVMKYYAIAFAGKSNKPLWNYVFRDEGSRQRQIDETVKNRKAILDYKQKRQDDRRNYQHDYEEGDILYTSWGYDETHVDFYEVTDIRGKVLIIRPIAKKLVREERGADYVVAVAGNFTGSAMRVTPSVNGVKIDGHHGSKWDGKPKYETAFGYGH